MAPVHNSHHPAPCRTRNPWALQNAALFGPSYESIHQGDNTAAWIKHQLRLLGLDAYSHTYSTGTRAQRSAACSNVHGILRADRGDAKESILLVTPLQYSAAHTGGRAAKSARPKPAPVNAAPRPCTAAQRAG